MLRWTSESRYIRPHSTGIHSWTCLRYLVGQKNRSPSPCSRGLVGLNSAVRLGFPVVEPVAFALVADINTAPTQAKAGLLLLAPHTSSFFLGLVGTYFFSSPLLACVGDPKW